MPEAHSVSRYAEVQFFNMKLMIKRKTTLIAEVFEIGKEDWRQPTVDYLQVIHVKKLIECHLITSS